MGPFSMLRLLSLPSQKVYKMLLFHHPLSPTFSLIQIRVQHYLVAHTPSLLHVTLLKQNILPAKNAMF